MQIIGLEVIRNNPRSPVEVAPPGKLALTYGNTLRITTGFNYQGIATDITLYGALGERRSWIAGGFVEKISNEAPTFKTPNSPTTFVPVTASVDIPITADIAPGADYDIQVKIREYPKAGLPEVDDVIEITGMPPTYELLEETIYPYAYIYDGPHDGGIFTFKSDLFTPASWIAGRLADAVEEEVRKSGGRMLEMRVYCDKSPLLWSNWRIEVVTVPAEKAGVAMSLGIVWWAVAILAALVIVLIIVITWAAKEIAGLFKRNPALEDVKVGWKKETLILTIQDSEKHWERTPTPIGTLQGMSEEDLRHLLNEIAEAEVPPGVPGLGLAIAGVGLAAVAILVALGLSARGK